MSTDFLAKVSRLNLKPILIGKFYSPFKTTFSIIIIIIIASKNYCLTCLLKSMQLQRSVDLALAKIWKKIQQLEFGNQQIIFLALSIEVQIAIIYLHH